MDEAVRCHRLCMVRRGRRVGLGSPDELTAAFEDRVVDVEIERAEQAIDALRTWPWATSATQLGRRVHVLLSGDAPPAREAASAVAGYLTEQGLGESLAHAAEPNLEDVFVALTAGETLAGEAT